MHDVHVSSAVVFDLFGTLTGFESALASHAAKLAAALGVSVEELNEQLRETYDARARGMLGDLRHQLATLADRIGKSPSESVLDHAVEVRMAGQFAVLQPRPGAIDVLEALREKGLKIGVLSDCTDEIPLLWPDSVYAPLVDVAVFSCSLGVRKPDLRTYAAVLAGLELTPDQCLYVGDGGSSELSGATIAGLRPIWLNVDGETYFRPDAQAGWLGESIGCLEEVLELVDG
jgi:putative hydrolase of the HAD superfamily